jgi:hypothetical protein
MHPGQAGSPKRRKCYGQMYLFAEGCWPHYLETISNAVSACTSQLPGLVQVRSHADGRCILIFLYFFCTLPVGLMVRIDRDVPCDKTAQQII